MLRHRTAFVSLLVLAACSDGDERPTADPGPPGDPWREARVRMVAESISGSGVKDERVLEAMRNVPRHEFVPAQHREQAYEDQALPIGHEQTISQPSIVAIMAEAAEIGEGERVLEIGTGSGYGAAVLAELAKEVYTIEILEPLAKRAQATLDRLGYDAVHVRFGDGYQGWPEKAPFDAIVVTAAPPAVPEPLKQQLREGGKLVIPVGTQRQWLRVLTRTKDGFEEEPLLPVTFVPMTGEAQDGK